MKPLNPGNPTPYIAKKAFVASCASAGTPGDPLADAGDAQLAAQAQVVYEAAARGLLLLDAAPCGTEWTHLRIHAGLQSWGRADLRQLMPAQKMQSIDHASRENAFERMSALQYRASETPLTCTVRCRALNCAPPTSAIQSLGTPCKHSLHSVVHLNMLPQLRRESGPRPSEEPT